MSSEDGEESKDVCEDLPQITNVLYDILGVAKTASQAEIKTAYRRMALLKHPDKCPNDPKAADNF